MNLLLGSLYFTGPWSDYPKQGFSIVNEDGFSPLFLNFFKIKEYIKEKIRERVGKSER
jgi:hypothetical protein